MNTAIIFDGARAMRELDVEEINEVSGGHPAFVLAAGLASVTAMAVGMEAFGEKIGKALYHAIN
jgi:hypothetical protein